MSSGPVPPALADTISLVRRGLDTSGGVELVRERLALLGKTVFLLSFGFWIFLFLSLVLAGGAPPAAVLRSPVALAHLFGSSMLGLLWLLASRRASSLRALGAIEAGCVVLGCAFVGGMTIGNEGQLLQTILAVMVTVMIRAILVPSTPRRTLVITALAFAPTIAFCAAFHHPTDLLPGFTAGYQKLHMTLNTILWSILGVTLATVTSSVTYGLRRQVAEALDIGQYTLEEKIGAGGMGEIWRARHRLLIRPAAVKLIRPQALEAMRGDPEMLMRRFEREARATAALTSPHTVQLYDFGVTDDGTLYYVMELLDGLDLDTLVSRHGPVPAERAIHILRQVCSSLADAHANGLVHRDIKPANVVLSRVGTTFDFAKVLDFGLVKLDTPRGREAEAVKLTAAGSTSGTPAFMAPEQVVAAPDADHRVDIYSLGCVAYWLLTGKLVFESDSAMKMMIEHASSAPLRPSTRVELPIPAELEDLIMECLEKDADRRPGTVDLLAARLEAVPLARPWTKERAESWWGKHSPAGTRPRPVADAILSQEARPVVRVGRAARLPR